MPGQGPGMTSRRIIIAAVAGVIGLAMLLALGIWQVQRLGEKQALIAEIEERLAAPPVALPADPQPERDRLLRVTVRGRVGAEELHVITSLRPLGAGYRVISPFTLDDGRRVLLDLGYVPQDMKDPASRPPQGSAGVTQVTGVLLWPRETDGFTPEPDLDRNIWFARNVETMADALETEPLMIVAESHGLGEWPRPVPPGVDLPNRHLEYALTWFGLAIAWAVMTVLFIRTELHGRPPPRL
ncbi:MAG TPA: SURF1 family protein [Paracoccaceae bacterium]|nr:SURF1 family protein [Paracoccaceae bacterium]